MPTGTPLTAVQIQTLRNRANLHTAARQRVLLLEDENRDLHRRLEQSEAEKEALRQQLRAAEEKIRQQEDANKKLRAMLFERQHGKPRIKRHRQPKPRTAASYTRPQPQTVTDHHDLVLTTCPDCGTAVGDPVSSRKRIIEDIVFQPQPTVTEWTIYRHWCTGCGTQVAGTIPGILPKTRIGPNTVTFVVLAKYRWNQPYAKIKDQLHTCFGLHISQGEIANLIARAALLVGDTWQEIVQAVKNGHTVHCDETGWHINGKKVWAHTFATEDAVLYEISASRGKQIAENMLAGFTGTRVTDCLPNYKHLAGSHQICWAHLTREAQENADRDSGNQERHHLQKIFDTIYADLRTATTQWEKAAALTTKRRCERRVTKLLRQHWRDERCRLLVNRLQDFHAALFTCLDHPGIPPDNNHAERVLRKLVVQRKISGGNRSPTHAEYHAKNMSVLETLRLENGNLLTNLQSVLQRGVAAQLAGG